MAIDFERPSATCSRPAGQAPLGLDAARFDQAQGGAFCPHCGFDLRKLEHLEDGRFSYDPQYGFFIDGARLKAAPQVHEVLGAVMSLGGTPAKRIILAERLGYENDEPENLISVLLCRARQAFAALGVPFPIETVWRVGIRWNPGATPVAHVKHGAHLRASDRIAA